MGIEKEIPPQSPEKKRKSESGGLVYFIEEVAKPGEEGAMKIGYSATPPRRRQLLQTGNSQRLVIWGTVPGTKEDEARLHGHLREDWIHLEWFRLTPQVEANVRMCLRVGSVPGELLLGQEVGSHANDGYVAVQALLRGSSPGEE